MGPRGSDSDLRHNVQALVSSRPSINAETIMKSRRDSDMRFAHSIMGGWGWGEKFLGKQASKRASKLAELLPQGMNLHTHFDPFMIFLFVLATSSLQHHSAKDALN